MTPVRRPTLAGFDPLGAEFIADPAPTFEQARTECPVFYHAPLDYWVITRYEDVVAALGDWRSFSQEAAGFLPVPSEVTGRISDEFARDTFLVLDPPEHTFSRKAINRAFTRTRVADLEPEIAAIANGLIDRFAVQGSCDLMKDFCYQLSLRTIVRLLGLPDDEELLGRYKGWADDFLVLVTPRTAPGEAPLRALDHDQLVARWSGMADARDFFAELVAERRARPRPDVISDMLHATRPDGSPAMSDERIAAHALELITAGTDTSANLMGEVTIRLSERPALLDAVRADPALLENTIEESLRFRGPALGMFRWTTRDVVVAGVTIPAGSRVQLSFESAGRDERRFACPHEFDVRRPDASEHLGFGRGRHFCLGAPLARLEARTGLEILYRRLPGLHVVPGTSLEYQEALIAAILTALPVAWDEPAPSAEPQ